MIGKGRIMRAGLAAVVLLAAAGSAVAEEIEISNYGVGTNGMPYGVAWKRGFFKEVGIDVTGIRSSPGGAPTIRNMLAGNLAFAEAGLTAILAATRGGADIKIISGTTDTTAEIGWVVDLVTAVRSVRAEMNITAQIPLVLAGVSAETAARAERWKGFVQRLARVADISSAAAAPPSGSVQLLVRGEVVAMPLKGVIDFAAEQARLNREMSKVEADIKRLDAKLGNADFLARAPEELVEGEREKREEAVARRQKIVEALDRLRRAA